MAECKHCGARLTPGMRWCWQCYTPIPVVVGVAVPKQPSVDEARVVPGAPPTRGMERIVSIPDVEGPSILRAGPTTFGIAGKLVLTALVAGVGVLGAWLAGLWVDVAGVAGLAFLVLVIGVYSIVAFLVLRSVWAPERPMRPTRVRRERIIYVEGPLVSITHADEQTEQPEQQQRPVL